MKKFLYTILIYLITFSSIQADEYKKLYLNEAIETALRNNIDLQATKIDIDIARNKIKIANRVQNPSLDAYYFMGPSGNSEPKQLGVSQNIELAKRKARKDFAKSELQLTTKNVSYTEFDLKMDVREAYVELVAAKSILDTLEQQKKLQEELLQIARKRAINKQVPLSDVLQAEIALNQLITQVNTAKVNVNKFLQVFNKVINTPDNITYDSKDNLFAEENNYIEMLTPAPVKNFLKFDDFIEQALENRFDIQIAKQEIDLAEKNLTVVTRQRIPDIQLNGGYAYKHGKYSESNSYENGAYAGASFVNIPLFYNYSPEIQNASYQLQQAELKYISTKNKATKDVKVAYDRFLTAAYNLNHYEAKIITSSEALIDTSKKSYEKGEIDIVSLIVMKQSYKSIIIGYTQAITEYYNSWTNFLREVNDENFSLIENL